VGSVIYERLSWKLKIGEPSDFGGFLLLKSMMGACSELLWEKQ
jgi:hypothetical protein